MTFLQSYTHGTHTYATETHINLDSLQNRREQDGHLVHVYHVSLQHSYHNSTVYE